jgi:hypothetical protein
MPESSITGVTIVPKEYEGTTGTGLDFTVLPGDWPRSQWEEILVASAFRALSAERGLPPVVGLAQQTANYSPSSEAPAEVEATIRQAASSAGADVVQLQVYQVYGIEPIVLLQVDQPATFLKNDLSGFLSAIHAYSPRYGAFYVEVIDKAGAFVWSAGANVLEPSGVSATRPDLAGCSPVKGLMEDTIPPCPA